MNNPSPSFLTKQIINRVVALYLYEHPKDISDYHLLTQDFIYAIGVHFVDFDKRPAYFEEGLDEE